MDIRGNCIASTGDEHGPIYVYQTKTSRILSFDGKIYQSAMKLKKINGLDLLYTRAMMTGLFFIPSIKIATIMGLGAGSMAKNLVHSFPEVQVHAVEYREAVAETAKKYFYLPDTERLVIHIDDALNHMKSTTIKSDIIFSDLYSAQGMEPKQVHASYLRDCKNALNDQGVLVLNICHSTLKSENELTQLLALEFANRLLSFKVQENTIVLAFKNAMPVLQEESLLAKSKGLQEIINVPMERFAQLLWDSQPS